MRSCEVCAMSAVAAVANSPRQNGMSLIELMVSIALGLSVVLVILSLFQGFSGGSGASKASQDMTANAELAFQLVAQQMRQAGYNPSNPRTQTPTINNLQIGTPPGNMPGMGIFACARGFSNGSGGGAANNIQSLTCNGTSTSTITYAFAVQFEADQFSPSASGGIPADCRGFAVAQQSMPVNPAGTVTYYVVENRYFIANGGLSCTGNGGTSTFASVDQPLVANIESMQMSFGASILNATGTTASFSAGYLSADELGPASGAAVAGVHASLVAGTPIARWRLVKLARVCLVVRAEQRTLFEPIGGSGTVLGQYYGCDPGTLIDITDGFERRAFIRHFALRNRIDTP